MDAVIVDDEDRKILVIQGKFVSSTHVDAEPLQEVLASWLRLQDLQSLQQDCNEKLKLKLEAVRRALDDEYPVEFELLTTGMLTDAARRDLKIFAEKLDNFDDFSANLQASGSDLWNNTCWRKEMNRTSGKLPKP